MKNEYFCYYYYISFYFRKILKVEIADLQFLKLEIANFQLFKSGDC
jgi:hypothetical protein